MDKSVLRNLDLDPTFYGLNKSTKRVLEDKYPTFDLSMTPADHIYTDGDVVEVKIKLSNFRIGNRVVIPEHIYINGVELNGSEFVESITSSKQYDIEVVHKGKTTIRTRTICVIHPIYCVFSKANGEFVGGVRALPELKGSITVKAIDNSCHKVTVNNIKDGQYLWILTPSVSSNLLRTFPIGLIENLSIVKIVDSGEFIYWRSKDLLNKGTWKFLLQVEADITFGYERFNCYSSIDLEYEDSVQITRLKVPLEERQKDTIIAYNQNSRQVVEKYISNDFTDEEWKKDDNWTNLTNEILTEGITFETSDGEILNSVR